MRTDKDLLERKLSKEHTEMLKYKQMAEDVKVPLQLAQTEIESLKQDLISAHKVELTLEKRTEKVEREKDVQMRAREHAEDKTKEQIDIRVEKERTILSLGEELQDGKLEVQKLRKIIFQLEKDRERLGNEVTAQRALNLVSRLSICLFYLDDMLSSYLYVSVAMYVYACMLCI